MYDHVAVPLEWHVLPPSSCRGHRRSLRARIKRFNKWRPPTEAAVGNPTASASASAFDQSRSQSSQGISDERLRATQAPLETVVSQPLHILSCNIRCVLSKLSELHVIVLQHDVHIILVQETWLDASVEQVDLHGYVAIARRDRSHSDNRGGVMAFVRDDVANV